MAGVSFPRGVAQDARSRVRRCGRRWRKHGRVSRGRVGRESPNSPRQGDRQGDNGLGLVMVRNSPGPSNQHDQPAPGARLPGTRQGVVPDPGHGHGYPSRLFFSGSAQFSGLKPASRCSRTFPAASLRASPGRRTAGRGFDRLAGGSQRNRTGGEGGFRTLPRPGEPAAQTAAGEKPGCVSSAGAATGARPATGRRSRATSM